MEKIANFQQILDTFGSKPLKKYLFFWKFQLKMADLSLFSRENSKKYRLLASFFFEKLELLMKIPNNPICITDFGMFRLEITRKYQFFRQKFDNLWEKSLKSQFHYLELRKITDFSAIFWKFLLRISRKFLF